MNSATAEPRASGLPRFAAPADGKPDANMVSAFKDAGVLILEDYVSLPECRKLRERALQLVTEFDPSSLRSVFSTTRQSQLDDRYFIESGDKIRFFLEEDAFDAEGLLRQPKEQCLNKMGHAMHDLDPVFDEFSHGDKLAATAAGVGLPDPLIIQSMYIFKPPHIGGEVVCHQDSTYLYTEPESCIGFWFALEDATVENGCMYFIPGQHRGPLRKRNYRVSDERLATDVLDNSGWPEELRQPAEAAAGTLVVFDGRAPHLSGPNRSPTSRHAYTLHAIDRHCHYPESNWLQRSSDLPLRGFRPPATSRE